MDKNAIILSITIACVILLTATIWAAALNKRKRQAGPILLVLSWFVVFMFLIGLFIYVDSGSYDRYGQRYTRDADVPYYTRTGESYWLFGEFSGTPRFVNVHDSADSHRNITAFVDDEGYLFFDEDNRRFIHQDTEFRDLYTDDAGNRAYLASSIRFNWTGGFDHHDLTRFFNRYIANPPSKTIDLPLIATLYILVCVVLLIPFSLGKNESRHRYFPYRFMIPAFAVMIGTVARPLPAGILILGISIITYLTIPIDVGMETYARQHDLIGFGMTRFDFFARVNKDFGNDWNWSGFKQFADPAEISRTRRIMLTSIAIHILILIPLLALTGAF